MKSSKHEKCSFYKTGRIMSLFHGSFFRLAKEREICQYTVIKSKIEYDICCNIQYVQVIRNFNMKELICKKKNLIKKN